MATVVFDCARVPEGTSCSVKILGERDDVLQAAHDHMAATHGLTGGSDLEQKVKGAVEEHDTKYGMWAN
jgi:predicted small metal-binding protein